MKDGFLPDQYVVYPSHGVGRVIEIEKREIAGQMLEMYVIEFEKEKMTQRVPIEKIKENYNSRDELITYFINLHNDVNLRNKKPLLNKNQVDLIYLNFNDSNLIEYKLDIKNKNSPITSLWFLQEKTEVNFFAVVDYIKSFIFCR